jgi:hypothetical protein
MPKKVPVAARDSGRPIPERASAVVPPSLAMAVRNRYFPPFSRAPRVLTSQRACRIAVSSRPMKVEGEAQVKAASGEDYDRGAT